MPISHGQASMARHSTHLAATVVPFVLFAQGSCPSGWSKSPSGHCYWFIDTNAGFQNCLRKCEDLNASLACVRDEADNSFLVELLMFDGDSRGPAFIGLTDQFGEGSWQWVATGCTSTFFSWANPEHGGYKEHEQEDCATMPPWHDLSGSDWNGANCRCSRGCICEYGASTKDEYTANRSSYGEEADIECQEDVGFLRMYILAGIAGCICCGTVVGLCICYHCKCCCWEQRKLEPVIPYQHGEGPIVVGQPVELVQVGSKAGTVTPLAVSDS
mmetsp:Transcript_50834/g.147564  ORF Transcript_50834/g.147564 Transcript_50834/m.147564 type:complete len:272 (+) Transcript_50834:50-865(+)